MPPDIEYMLEVDDALNDLRCYPWSPLFGQTSQITWSYTKTEHLNRLEQSIIQLIQEGHVNIAVTESMVSGSSVQLIIHSIQNIVSLYPHVKFNVLVHQHTIHEENMYQHPDTYDLTYGRLDIDLAPSINRLSIKQLGSPPDFRSLPREERKQAGIDWQRHLRESYGILTIANGGLNAIIGEDVDYQLSNSQEPVYVFDQDRIMMIQPTGYSTSRDIILNAVLGQYEFIPLNHSI